MKTILFQGDSITDAKRSRENEEYSGSGYATMIKGTLGKEYPNQFRFFNRGVSGDRIIDLCKRMKDDILRIHPDYLSILIGVNDVWHEVTRHNGVETQKFEILYDSLVQEVQQAIPGIKIILMEPFLHNGSVLEELDSAAPGAREFMHSDIKEKAAAVLRVAERNNLFFLPLQRVFDNALQYAPSSYWLIDGIHPTAMGHKLIADEWMRTFKLACTET